MTDDELREIERVWAATTPGPWTWREMSEFEAEAEDLVAPPDDDEFSEKRGYSYVLAGERHRIGVSRPNAEAIAKAPEHVNALLAEAKRLREGAKSTLDLIRYPHHGYTVEDVRYRLRALLGEEP